MKLRILATVFALFLSFPLARAATEPTPAEKVAAAVKANPKNAGAIVEAAVKANPDQAAAITGAAVAAFPAGAATITGLALRAVRGTSVAGLATYQAIVGAAAGAAPGVGKVLAASMVDIARLGGIPSFSKQLALVANTTNYVPQGQFASNGATGDTGVGDAGAGSNSGSNGGGGTGDSHIIVSGVVSGGGNAGSSASNAASAFTSASPR